MNLFDRHIGSRRIDPDLPQAKAAQEYLKGNRKAWLPRSWARETKSMEGSRDSETSLPVRLPA